MKAARDSGEDFHDAKTTCWEEIKRDWNCGKSTSKTDCGTGRSFEVRGDFVLSLIIGPRLVVEVVFNCLWPRGIRHGAKDVGQAFFGKGFGPVWTRGTGCVCAQHPRIGTFQDSVGRMVSSSSSF